MDIIFIRHGSTDVNNKRILQGQSIDSDLNDEGIKQVKDIIPELEKSNLNLIFSSPLRRAHQSAEIIGQHFKIPIKFDKRIMERDYGALGGKNWKDGSKEMEVNEEEFISMQRNDRYDFRPYGGESSEDVKKRMVEFINYVKEEYPDKKILVATHGGVIRLMHNLYKEEPFSKHKRMPNASIHIFNI